MKEEKGFVWARTRETRFTVRKEFARGPTPSPSICRLHHQMYSITVYIVDQDTLVLVGVDTNRVITGTTTRQP